MTRSPFRFLRPTFFAGLLEDPLLLVRVRPLKESCLFDCGQIHHLAKRVVKSVSALFITHAHMDHFMGFDLFVRHNHVSPRTFDIFGPPGIANKVANKLAGYDWNLTGPDWCTFRVHEIHPGKTRTFLFPGADGFPCRPLAETPRSGTEIYRNPYLEVKAELCDHRIPALIFRATECPSFLLDETRMERLGLIRGKWLRRLKKCFYGGFASQGPLPVPYRRGDKVVEEPVADYRALYDAICREEAPAGIGYLTDIGATPENMEKVAAFMQGVTLLVCECTFLAEEQDKARVSFHLSTSDLNRLVEKIRPRFVLPMHFSKSYDGKSRLLYDQLEMPSGVTLLHLPEHLTPRPLLAGEAPRLCFIAPDRCR
ncbi:MAG: MBL fold metallo-hydrolase [Geobacteraceae bacterium]|jgi:ribonuclease Z